MSLRLRGDLELQAACEELLHLVRRLRALPEEGGQGERGGWVAGGLFREHRRYVPGDDPRRVDWHALARTGELFVKVYETERARTLPVLVDLSASLEFGRPPRWHLAVRAAAALLFAGLALAEEVDMVLCHGQGPATRLTLRGAGDLAEGWTCLEQARPGGRGSAAAAVAGLLERRRGGVLWWISDFLPLDRETLGVAVEHSFRVRGLLPLVPQDSEPELAGLALVRGLEGGAEVRLKSTARLRARVGQLWQQEMERVRARLGATGGDLHLLSQARLVQQLARALV